MRLRVLVESSGSMVEVDVLPQLMVLAVKEIMALHTAIPVPCQQLWWRTMLLDDASVLKNVLPPMFFHASLDTITPEYYRLLGDIGDKEDGQMDDLQDLERVRKEAFLTLKVVNPSTSALAATLGIRSSGSGGAFGGGGNGDAPASLRHSFLRATESGHDAAAAFEGGFRNFSDDDDRGGGAAAARSRHEQHQYGQPRVGGSGSGGGGGGGGSGSRSSRSSRSGVAGGHGHDRDRDGGSSSGRGSNALTPPSFTRPVARWTARETAVWLASLGRAYHRYCHEFVESGIDGNMLVEICRDEASGRRYLQELGVKSIHSAKMFFDVRQRLAAAGGGGGGGGGAAAGGGGGVAGDGAFPRSPASSSFYGSAGAASGRRGGTPTTGRRGLINTPSRYHNPHLFEKNQKQLLKFRHQFQEQIEGAQTALKQNHEMIIRINENQASQHQQIYHYCSNLRNIVDLLESKLIDEVRSASDALADRCQKNVRHCGEREVALRRKLERVQDLARSGGGSDSAEVVDFLDELQLKSAEEEQEAAVRPDDLPRLDVMNTVERLNSLIENQPIDI